jgi:hypothetical protein
LRPENDTIAVDFIYCGGLAAWGLVAHVMPEHKFKIGQRLFLARPVGSNVPDGPYIVVKRLPRQRGEFEYQVKSVTESDERIVRESQLRPSPWRNTPGRPP